MQNLFSFGGDTNDTPDSLKMKRAFAQKLMGNMSNAPKNVGEGFNAIGNGLLMGALMGSVNEGEKSAAAKDQGLFTSLMNAFTGGGGQAPAAAPAMPQSEGQTATPTLALSQNAGNGPVNAGVTASPFAKAAYDKFISAGFSPAGAASLVGNTYAESGYNPTLSHDGGTGVGILGFRDPKPGQGRKTALMNFASSRGADWRDPMTQVDYAIHELNTSEKGRGDALRSATDLREANNATISYLRPAGWTPQNPAGGHNYDGRLRFSNAIYDKFGRQSANGQQPVQVAAAGGNVQVPPQQPSGDFLAQREAAQNAPMQAQPQQVAQAPAQQPAPAGMSPQQRAVFSEATRALQSPYASQQTKSAAMMIIQKFIQQEQKTPAQIEKEQLELAKARGEVANIPIERESKLTNIAKTKKELDSDQLQETYDPEGNPVKGYMRNGKFVAVGGGKREERTADQKNYEAYVEDQKNNGQKPLSMFEWGQQQRKAAATNLGGGSDKQFFDYLDESGKTAASAATGLRSIDEARDAVLKGGIFGAGADTRLGLQKVAAFLGIGDTEEIVNTETFRSAIAPQVAALMKATVGSANISNSDREFAEKAAGGAITLDDKSIARLLDIMEKGNTAVIERHNSKVDRVYPDGKSYDRERAIFRVDLPERKSLPPPAIKSQQEYNAMPSGSKFTAPDGSIRVKP